MSLTAPLSQLDQQAAAAFYRQAVRPFAQGAADEHERLWSVGYEARNDEAEQNPLFAATLLPASGSVALSGVGLPSLPLAVRAVADATEIQVAVDIAGVIGVRVVPPGIGSQPFNPALTTTGTRATASFPAPADGLYQLELYAGNVRVVTVYVPVLRALWRTFREWVRRGSYPFVGRRPPLSPEARAVLARLVWADAAAQAGDAALFARVVASANELPAPPSPVALYPTHA